MALELEPLETEARRDQPANFDPKPQQGKYVGPEHRIAARRLKPDRRAMLRFEPGKKDRRSDGDRRGGSWGNLYSL